MKLTTTLLLPCACLLMTSCSVFQQTSSTASHRPAKEPKFIRDVSLGSVRATGSLQFDASTIEAPAEVLLPAETAEPVKDSLLLKYAAMLNVGNTAISNQTLYNFIDEWYGVPHRMGGDSKSGIDCSAFVQKLYEEVFNTPVVRSSFEQFKMCNEVCEKDSLKEGDLVFFRRGRRIAHVGVYLKNNYFVHSSTSQGVTISNLDERYWKKTFKGAGKVLVPKDSL